MFDSSILLCWVSCGVSSLKARTVCLFIVNPVSHSFTYVTCIYKLQCGNCWKRTGGGGFNNVKDRRPRNEVRSAQGVEMNWGGRTPRQFPHWIKLHEIWRFFFIGPLWAPGHSMPRHCKFGVLLDWQRSLSVFLHWKSVSVESFVYFFEQ